MVERPPEISSSSSASEMKVCAYRMVFVGGRGREERGGGGEGRKREWGMEGGKLVSSPKSVMKVMHLAGGRV